MNHIYYNSPLFLTKEKGEKKHGCNLYSPFLGARKGAKETWLQIFY
ncbi:MAG: hypothetical protein P4L35_09730 [Ignavibacteriaceae bacterium]|nr:hypothetical protein [Ignavibacteriaceae bacterium]